MAPRTSCTGVHPERAERCVDYGGNPDRCRAICRATRLRSGYRRQAPDSGSCPQLRATVEVGWPTSTAPITCLKLSGTCSTSRSRRCEREQGGARQQPVRGPPLRRPPRRTDDVHAPTQHVFREAAYAPGVRGRPASGRAGPRAAPAPARSSSLPPSPPVLLVCRRHLLQRGLDRSAVIGVVLWVVEHPPWRPVGDALGKAADASRVVEIIVREPCELR
jgi:hypothetical protein